MAAASLPPARWLLIGNSRWHWAAPAPGGEPGLRVHHSLPPPDQGPEQGSDQGAEGFPALLGWAAVGPLPSAIPLPSQAQLGLADVPLACLPAWLGLDRALAGWGGWRLVAGPVLVADAGTVLSLTRVDADGCFAGGRLLAGVALQLRAMADATALLPAIAMHEQPLGGQVQSLPLWPHDTATAMRSGVVRGLAAAINAGLAEAKQQEPRCRLLLTGGDGAALAALLAAEHRPDLCLEALAALRPLPD